MKTMALLQILVVYAVVTSSHAFGANHCGKDMPGCTCLVGAVGEREVQCGNETANVVATIKPSGELQIQCTFQTSTPELLEMLAGMNTGPIKYLHMRYCPMPITPLDQLIDKIIGAHLVNETKSLIIQSHDKLDLHIQHFKGFKGVNKFELSSNQLEVLPEDMLDGMDSLTWLDLRDNAIKVLPPRLLKATPRLSVIELGNNQISELPEIFFSNLTSLRLLNLWKNRLSSLNHSLFSTLHDLENLDLFSNGLQDLPKDIFQNLTKLKDLNLSSNNFTSIPSGVFKDLKNLTRFRMLDNLSKKLQLPDELFANLTQLRDVIISRSGIHELPENLLRGTSSLKNFTIAGNKLVTLPPNVFQDTINITLLDLSGNKLNSLPDKVFSKLEKLEVLKINNNNLSVISDELLQSLKSLQEVDFSNNKIINIESAAFQGVQSTLRIIRLDNNKLSFDLAPRDAFGFHSPFHMCNAIQELYLSNNDLTEIAADWRFNLLKLRILNLTHNNISLLTVQDLHFLSDDLRIDLRNNKISELDMSTAEVLALYEGKVSTKGQEEPTRSVRVLLGENELNCTSCVNYHLLRYHEGRMRPDVRKLVDLDTSELKCFDGRAIEDVSSESFVCSVPSLIRHCPGTCSCKIQPHRRALILKCCSLPNSIPPIRGLNRTDLTLENCNVKVAPTLLGVGNLTNLTGLFLGNNNLTEIHYRNLPSKPEIIELHNNNLTEISQWLVGQLENTSSLARLTLSGNPWRCDCEARPLVTYLQSHYAIVGDWANVTCADGRSFQVLSASDLCSVTTAVAASMAIAALGILLGAAAALYYRYQQQIKVWLYARNMCLWFVTEDELDKDKKYDAFISYSHKDESFVAEHLVPGLEPPFKLCIHVRDWVAGDWIPEQIARSVQNSRRTLVVLSPSFIDSVWGRLEFRAAHQQAMSEGRVRVIVILLEDVGPMDQLDPELRAYLTMNTYLQWGDPWFWDKLRYALPHRHDIVTNTSGWGWGRRRVRDAPSVVARRIEDKLELIRTSVVVSPPSPSTITPPAAVNGHTKMI